MPGWALWAALLAVAAGLGWILGFETYTALVAGAVVLCAGTLAFLAFGRARLAGLSFLVTVAVLAPLGARSVEGVAAQASPGGRALGASLPIATLVCLAWLVRRALARHPVVLEGTRSMWAAAAVMGTAVLSFVTGQYPWVPAPPAPIGAQAAGLALFLVSVGLFVVVAHDTRSQDQLERLTWLFIGAGTCAVALSVMPPVVSRHTDALVQPESLGSAFWTWMAALSLGQALGNLRLSRARRVALLAVTGLVLMRGLLAAFSWVSGWLPPLVAVGTILLLRFPWFTLAGALTATAPILLLGRVAVDRLVAGESYSLMTRLQAMDVLWQLVQHSPWVGFGPANYYRYTLLYPILGWYVSFSSHNHYIDLVTQTGLLGLVAFSWFVIELARLGLSLRRRFRGDFACGYVLGALGGLAGCLVSGMLADWIIPFYYNIGVRGFRSSLLFWVFLGGLHALRRLEPTWPSNDSGQSAPTAGRVPRAAWTAEGLRA